MMKEKWLWWLVILIGAVAGVVYLSLSPVKGKISYQSGKSPTPSPMEYIRYDAGNFSFAYENKYELQENGSSFELVGRTGVPDQIVITVKDETSSNIEDVSGVLMRRLKNTEYTEEKINWGETEGVLFKHVGSLELAAFFIKDGKAVTVAMTANTNDETGLREEFQKLVDSMEIKK
jgi:hypothetical protein